MFLATLACFNLLSPGPQAAGEGATLQSPVVGLDFIAFYTAGTFVRQGRADEMYDLHAVHAFQRDLARRNKVDLGDALGPWWNPPFYAWVFVPLSRLPFPWAVRIWQAINIACVGASAWVLRRMLPASAGWRQWALIPALLLLSAPFINLITHAQNTGTSLLLLCLTVSAWRARRAWVAGCIAGLLFYKPQLGMVLAAALVAGLGWRAFWGLAATGSALLGATLATLPGALEQFLTRVPANIHYVQNACVYNWDRHVTFKAFWRLLLQGFDRGETSWGTATALALCTAGLAVALLRVSPLARWLDPLAPKPADPVGADAARDRFIAATIAATPLLMPFYFDYDLLLLAVPATLLARELMLRDPRAPMPGVDRWLLGAWPALYAWLMLNAAVAERTRLNLAAPLLCVVASLLIARVRQPRSAAAVERAPAPLARAA